MYIALNKDDFFQLIDIVISKTTEIVKIGIYEDYISYIDNNLGIEYQFAGTKSELWDCALILVSTKYSDRVALI